MRRGISLYVAVEKGSVRFVFIASLELTHPRTEPFDEVT